MLEEFLRHHVAHTRCSAAMAGMFTIILQIITVIEGKLLPCPDFANRHQPNSSLDKLRLAIRHATVIQKSRRVPTHVPIQVVRVIDCKNIFVVPFTTREGFPLRDFLAEVFDDARSRGNVVARESASAVDGRWLENDGSENNVSPVWFESHRRDARATKASALGIHTSGKTPQSEHECARCAW